MNRFTYTFLIFGCTLALAACRPAGIPQTETAGPESSVCPVTLPAETPFIPPEPFPPHPPDPNQFWHGSPALWTALPADGSWAQLAHGEKFFWWAQDYDFRVEPVPALTVTARRLDTDAGEISTTDATNASHPSFGTAMLIGVTLPSPGCWEITGMYQDTELELVVFVPG